jgi:uncharacterized protein
MSDHTSVQDLQRILRACKTIAVVGLSADWNRPSYFAAKYMQSHGYTIIPINPKYTEILDQTCYPSLLEVPQSIAKTIEMVDCFRKPEDIFAIAQDAITIGAKCFWQQLGIENRQAHQLVAEAGLDSVMDRCVKIEHARLFGGLGWAGVNTKIISAKKLNAGNSSKNDKPHG